MILKHDLLTRICPVCKGIAKRHRRRNYKFQYKCTKCEVFFTEESKYKTQGGSCQYDEFILEFIRLRTIGEKIKVTKICGEFDIKRPTYYRMLFRLDLLAFISKWFCKEGIISHKRVVAGTLQFFLVDYTLNRLDIQLKSGTQDHDECEIIFKSNRPFVQIWNETSNILILGDSDKKCFVKVSVPYDEDQISLVLSHFQKLKLHTG